MRLVTKLQIFFLPFSFSTLIIDFKEQLLRLFLHLFDCLGREDRSEGHLEEAELLQNANEIELLLKAIPGLAE